MRRDRDEKGTDLEYDSDKKEYVPRRITRALVKTTKENHAGKLVWGYCSGWWPGKYIEDNDYTAILCIIKLAHFLRLIACYVILKINNDITLLGILLYT